ncbi:hypothetical protein H4S08_004521, partial [Coemansia sp. RSA 1365]
MASADTTVHEIKKYTEKGDQLVDILHNPVKENVCLRVASVPFSIRRRETPAYSRLLAISNQYGYMVAGTPQGLVVFQTRDAQDELFAGSSKGTNTATTLKARKDIDLTSHGQVTHVGVSADEQRVIVCTIDGNILVFSAQSLVEQGSNLPSNTINVGREVRDMRVNPKEMAALVAVLTLDGELLMVDIDSGSLSSVVKDDARVTAICWSRKGKQIVCGDSKGVLTQRTPTDGALKRTIEPQTSSGDIVEGAGVLAVDWPETHTFFALYGQLPDEAFVSGSGGGNDEFQDNATAGYVVTRLDKSMPFTWIHVEDPCSSMMCPERYPGFHIASVGQWGGSAADILVMAGTGSDATMTIGKAATAAAADGSADAQSLTWVEWDIDGHMAAMPLSALDSGNDTFPVGMAIDYTGQRDMPSAFEDGERVKPVPILWILNTDACLLGYHICNTFEMQSGQRPADMVSDVKVLSSTAEQTKDTPAKLPPFASGAAFGKDTSSNAFGGGFGQTSPFGKTGSITPIVKAPTSMTSKHVFGSTSKLSGGSTFNGFGGAVAQGAKSIFDTPASGPSIFDAPSKGESPFGVAKPFNSEKKPSTQIGTATDGSTSATTGFGAFAASKSAASTPFGKSPASSFGGAFGKSAGGSTPKAAEQVSKSTAPASSFGALTTSEPAATTPFSKPSASPFGGAFGKSAGGSTPKATEQVAKPTAPASSFGALTTSKPAATTPFGKPSAASFGNTWGQATSISASKANESSAVTGLGGLSFNTQSSNAESKSALKSALKPQSLPFGALSASVPFSVAKASPEEHNTHVSFALPDNKPQALEDERRKQAADDEEQQKEQQRQEEQQRELEQKTQQLIDQQYIKTCNSFDAKLKALAQSLHKSDAAISQARAAQLPPIRIDPAVEEMAGLTSRMQAMSIDDTELWNRTAGVLLEALDVSRLELRGSQRSLARQMSTHLKAETKREEVARMLNAVSPTATDSGLNPLQREYQRRLKSSFDLISKRAADVEQVVNVEAENHEAKRNEAPPQLRAPSFDLIQRTLHNVQKTLSQKNLELDELAQLVDGMDLGSSLESVCKKPRRPPISPCVSTDAKPSPRTAADGVPWSPVDLPFNAPPAKRGYGLRDEDLLVGSKPLTPPLSAKPAEHAALSPTSSWFSHTKVRELVPRSSKIHRRPSLVSDGPDADRDDAGSAVPTSVFSSAAAYLQTRRQRAVVRDVLTRPSRLTTVIRSPDASIKGAMKINQSATVPKTVPMPNLDRYVEAFGKLRVADEPEPEFEPEPISNLQKSDQVTDALGFGNRPLSEEWTCDICELKSPGSASACQVCEAVRPGVSQSVAAPPKANAPATSLFGGSGFQLSGGLSFGAALSAAAPQSTTSSPFGASSKSRIDMSGSKELSFDSFVPPGGAPASAITTSDADVKSQGVEWVCDTCELKSPDSASACQVCEAVRPGVLQSAAAPPKASAPATSLFGGSGFQLSGGLSFGAALSAAAPQSTTSSPFGASSKSRIDMSGSKELSFDSFVPPGGAPAPAITTSDADAKSQGVEWICDMCELKNSGTATKCIVCDAQKPANPRLASSITSVFQPQAVSDVDAENSYVSDELSGEESEDSASDNGSSAYSSEYSGSSVTGSVDGLSESDSDSEQGDVVPTQDEKAQTAKPDVLESENEDSDGEDSGSEADSDQDNVDSSSLTDEAVVDGSAGKEVDSVTSLDHEDANTALPDDKAPIVKSGDEKSGSEFVSDRDDVHPTLLGVKGAVAGSTFKEADSVTISEHDQTSVALPNDKASATDMADEKTESKTASDNADVDLTQPSAVVSDAGSVDGEAKDEAILEVDGPDLAQPKPQTSNVETLPSEPEDKDVGGEEQDEEDKSYAAALKEAILDRVDSDSVDTAPIGLEDRNASDKHPVASGTEQQSMSNREESDVASIVDDSDHSEDGDATTAARPAEALEEHDSDGFVHVSEHDSQKENKEDDVSSTPASICKTSKVPSEDSDRGVPPVSLDVSDNPDNVETGAKTLPKEPVTVTASETADGAENRKSAQKDLAPVPTEDASIGNQDDVDKFDVGRLQILSGRASVEYIVEQALGASYCDNSESKSGSGTPKAEAPKSGAADEAKPVTADKPDTKVAAP